MILKLPTIQNRITNNEKKILDYFGYKLCVVFPKATGEPITTLAACSSQPETLKPHRAFPTELGGYRRVVYNHNHNSDRVPHYYAFGERFFSK